MNIETIQQYVTLIKDMLTGLAALTADVVAILGFKTWKKQLYWKTQYELAQRLAKAAYKIRDTLNETLRVFAVEVGGRPLPTENINPDNVVTFMNRMRPLYQQQLQEIQAAFTELDSVLLESEAIWGSAVKDGLKPLQDFAFRVSSKIRSNLDTMEKLRMNYDQEELCKEYKRMIINFVMVTPSFQIEFIDALRKVENFLKPYLKI
jgi:hypothetical protein